MIPWLPKGFVQPVCLGRGGFGSVYRVRQTALDRLVAVKICRERDRHKRRELFNEGKTQARVSIPCVPQVFDAFMRRNSVYIVMQWIRGISLQELVAAGTDEGERLCVASALIHALAALHGQGYAHRDIKPANILVDGHDAVYFIDFGFTQKTDEERLSVSHRLQGTPAYMAPELFQGGYVDEQRADVYACGLILRDVLCQTGQEDFAEICADEHPAQRPASGLDMLLLWRERVGIEQPQRPDPTRAAHLEADMFSQRLCDAARLLRNAGRHTEAYWLVVESVECNTLNGVARSLMQSFSNGVRQRNAFHRFAPAGVVSLVCFLVLGAFLLGRNSWDRVSENTNNKIIRRRTILSTDIRTSDFEVVPGIEFHQDSTARRLLSGVLVIRNDLPESVVRLNGDTVSVTIGRRDIRKVLPYGEHILSVGYGTEPAYWREHITLLPFQTKIIAIPGKKGGAG